MKTVLAFAAGLLLGVAAAGLLSRAWRPEPVRRANPWRARAERAERDLAEARRRVDALAARLQDSANRLDTLAAELEKQREASISGPPPTQAGATEEAAGVARAEPTPTPEFQPVSDEQWDALVRGALESEVERRLGTTLPPERMERLMESLRELRDASQQLTEDEPGAGVGTSRAELTRTIVLLQADRVFRDELGIGVGDFLRSLDEGQVEEIPR